MYHVRVPLNDYEACEVFSCRYDPKGVDHCDGCNESDRLFHFRHIADRYAARIDSLDPN